MLLAAAAAGRGPTSTDRQRWRRDVIVVVGGRDTAFICALFATKWRRRRLGTCNASINGIGRTIRPAADAVFTRFHGNLFIRIDGCSQLFEPSYCVADY